jgi:hypothetical protein
MWISEVYHANMYGYCLQCHSYNNERKILQTEVIVTE